MFAQQVVKANRSFRMLWILDVGSQYKRVSRCEAISRVGLLSAIVIKTRNTLLFVNMVIVLGTMSIALVTGQRYLFSP